MTRKRKTRKIKKKRNVSATRIKNTVSVGKANHVSVGERIASVGERKSNANTLERMGKYVDAKISIVINLHVFQRNDVVANQNTKKFVSILAK